MSRLWLTLIILMAGFSGSAQADPDINIQLRELKTAKDDSNKVKLLFDIGAQYEGTSLETAKYYYNQSLSLSKKIGYTLGEIKYASYYTAVLNAEGKFDSSLQLNKNSMKAAKRLNDELITTKVVLNTANSFHLLSKNDSAIYYYMQSLSVLEKTGNKRMLGIAYSNLQNIYLDLLQYNKAIEYGKKGIEIFRKDVDDPITRSYCLSNLGIIYSSLKKYDTATAYLNEALELSHKNEDQYTESSVLLNLGDIDYQLESYERSKEKFDQANSIARAMNLSEIQAIALKGMAMYHLERRNYRVARQYADTALIIAKENNMRKQTQKIYKLLSDISYASQDFKAAHEFDKKEDALNDSISGDNLQKLSTEYEIKYETEKKQAQIKLQKAQLKERSIVNYFLIAGAAALLIISLLFFRNYRNRQKLQQAKIDELETEKKLTATEAVLKGEEQERVRLAKDLHDGLGGMLSGIKFSLSNMKENLVMTPDNAQAFERSIDMLDSSIKEMRRVAHNMMPEILVKYGLDTALKEFCSEINRSGAIHINYQSVGMHGIEVDQTRSVTIYRIVQELVNNVIKHAQAKNILVQVHHSSQGNILAITVEDDGRGLDVNALKTAAGMGWRSIQNRVEFLKGTADIQSSTDKGTSVMMEIPV